MHPAFWILLAMVAGWIVQLYLTYRQGVAFNRDVATLRASGKVSVGSGGKRYRGGRAYVAIAVDDFNIVRDAITLTGWTTFARAKPLPVLVGMKANQLKGTREIPELNSPQREAARQAATFLTREGEPTTIRLK